MKSSNNSTNALIQMFHANYIICNKGALCFLCDLGFMSVGTGVIGSLVGGIIMSKKKLSPVQAVLILILSTAAMCVCTAITFFLTCPPVDVAGSWQDGQ